MTTAIIPARGGSTGVPKKNLQYVGEKTLIARAVEKCKRATDTVIVSTDDADIAAEAMSCGATIHERPADLATSEAPVWPTVQLIGSEYPDERYALVQCTAPGTTVGDIRNTLNRAGDGCDIAVACHESHAVILREDGSPVTTTFPVARRQDHQKQFAISGSVWAFGHEHLKHNDIYTGTIGIVLSESPYRLDIDTPADLAMANRLFHAADYQMWGDFNGGFWI